MQIYNLPDGRKAVHYRDINAVWSNVHKSFRFTFRLNGRVESHGSPNVFAVCDEIDKLIAIREAIRERSNTVCTRMREQHPRR